MTGERIKSVKEVDIGSKPHRVTFETTEGRQVRKKVSKGKGVGETLKLSQEVADALNTLKPLAKEVILRRGLPYGEDEIVFFDKLEGQRKGNTDYMEARRLACVTLGRNRIGSVKAAVLILQENPEVLTRLCLGTTSQEKYEIAVRDFASVIVEYYSRNFPANAVSPRK